MNPLKLSAEDKVRLEVARAAASRLIEDHGGKEWEESSLIPYRVDHLLLATFCFRAIGGTEELFVLVVVSTFPLVSNQDVERTKNLPPGRAIVNKNGLLRLATILV